MNGNWQSKKEEYLQKSNKISAKKRVRNIILLILAVVIAASSVITVFAQTDTGMFGAPAAQENGGEAPTQDGGEGEAQQTPSSDETPPPAEPVVQELPQK